MGHIYDTMLQFFRDDGWKFQQYEGCSFLRMGFAGDNGSWECIADAKDDRNLFVFYSIASIKVPEKKRAVVADYLTRANYGLLIGNFEMDFDDGEVRYKSCIDVTGDRLTPALIKRLVYANVFMMDKYLPGLMSVIYGNTPPAQAIAVVENRQDLQ